MTTNEIKITIAKSLGWTHNQKLCKNPYESSDFEITEWFKLNDGKQMVSMGSHPPNYPESLDACREFELSLSPKQLKLYCEKLCNLTHRGPNEWHDEAIISPAFRRCEAYLRTIGKWKD